MLMFRINETFTFKSIRFGITLSKDEMVTSYPKSKTKSAGGHNKLMGHFFFNGSRPFDFISSSQKSQLENLAVRQAQRIKNS